MSSLREVKPQDGQDEDKPCRRVIDVSSGDPQGAGMPPLSFVRQVLAACLHPQLLEDACLPVDVQQRARQLLAACSGGSVGSYSSTATGLPSIKSSVAEFITRRDGGVASCPDDIIFASGSQKALQMVLHLMAGGGGGAQVGLLTPVPCPHTLPPLLDATGLTQAPYRLNEGRGWAVDPEELRRSLQAARGRCEPRALYVSNPGDPTGHVQDRKTMEEVIRFAVAERLVLLAQEVNQDSVLGPQQFLSYRRVLLEMDQLHSQTLELVSFHSISSAFVAECGLRGGFMEVVNMDPAVKLHLKRIPAINSPPVLAQLAVQLMVRPPAPGDASHHKYTQEILHRKETLSHNARRACDFLNGLRGVTCQPAMAGVFLYPRLQLPVRMIEEAKKLEEAADVLYCRWLLQEEGVCLGPGCQNGHGGGGGGGGDIYVRLCVLAPPAVLDQVLSRMRCFHLRLLDRFL